MDFEYHLVVGEAENMSQLRVQTCSKSYSLSTLIIILMPFTNYVIKENTCVALEKHSREW